MSQNIFSDSWHTVAKLKLSLLNDARIHKQFYRGQLWYVIEEPYNNQFFRVSEPAYRFLVQLNPQQSVEELWEATLENNPEQTPTQDEVIKLLSQLHSNNLLFVQNSINVQDVFNRRKEQQDKELKNQLVSFLYIRIPLWNPESWLRSMDFFTRQVFSWNGLLVWFMCIGLAFKLILDHRQAFFDQTQGILSADNMILLYLTLVVLKIFHEMGHAFMTKRFGGVIPRMGVMLLLLTPIPYLDASSSWSFRLRRHRILVGAGGMLAELFIASLATMVWVNTGSGPLHSVAFNAMIIGSVSSLMFNGNPLLKFDSYYMLSDMIGIPNLYQRSRDIWLNWGKRIIFKVKDLPEIAQTARESWWLGCYGILSFAYRLLISVSIMSFVADQWFLLGVVMLALFVYVWFMKPIVELSTYIASNPELHLLRSRATGLSLVIVFTMCFFLATLPLQRTVKLAGVVQVSDVTQLHAPVGGRIEIIQVHNGQAVKENEVLFVFSARDLQFDQQQVEAELQEISTMIVQATESNNANIKPLKSHKILLEGKLEVLQTKLEQLQVKAPCKGIFVNEKLNTLSGTWVNVRELLGKVIPMGEVHFVGVAPQEVAYDLFDIKKLEGEVMLHGLEGEIIPLENLSIIPYEKNKLPSPILGWRAGGDVPVRDDDPDGVNTKSSFFKLQATLKNNPSQHMYHGRSGLLRIVLPPQTIFDRSFRQIKQVVQKRYQF